MAIFLTVFITVLLTATLLYDRLLEQQARQTATGIAGHAFAAVNAQMPYAKSRESVQALIEKISLAHRNSPYRIAIYRGPAVAAQFGGDAHPIRPAALTRVLQSGIIVRQEEADQGRHLYPLVAGESCLACHRNVREGEVLGAMEVSWNIRDLATGMRREYRGLFLTYGVMALLLAGGVTMLIVTRVNTGIERLRSRTEEIKAVRDLNRLHDLAANENTFHELNQAFAAVAALSDRLREVAVDKKVLHFEVKVLQKFVITSNVIEDWTLFIKDLLIDINDILDTYALVAFFREKEDAWRLEIFWRNAPSPLIREQLERVIRQRFYIRFELPEDSPAVTIIHHDAGAADLPLPEHLALEAIELHTKSIFLDAPKVGGIVGIGVQANPNMDPIYRLVLDSVLATLMNLVGSVKALAGHTEALNHNVTRDPLTNLRNQRIFWEMLQRETERAERLDHPFGLLCLDIDNFRAINNRYGHTFGDLFLQRFAGCLQETVRDGDLIARYGGDEFVIILPESGREQVETVANRLRENCAALRVTAADGSAAGITVSVGIAMYPEHGRTARDLFVVADSMMYRRKGEGKNGIAAPDTTETLASIQQAGEMDRLVCRALEEQSVIPYFQPIFSFKTGLIHAHELLMRIRAEDGRVVPAGEFIKAAERIGLTWRLDALLLEKAVAAMATQNYQGRLFVNLSPRALIIPEFLTSIKTATSRCGVAPERLVFEITEREAVRNVTLLRKFVLHLKNAGYKFAIDDFGAGYASFKYLKLFPVDYLKIDGDFIRNLETDAEYLAYVKSIVTLARELGLQTVAEYVENAELCSLIAEKLAIDFGQGYYAGRPEPLFKDCTRPVVPGLAAPT